MYFIQILRIFTCFLHPCVLLHVKSPHPTAPASAGQPYRENNTSKLSSNTGVSILRRVKTGQETSSFTFTSGNLRGLYENKGIYKEWVESCFNIVKIVYVQVYGQSGKESAGWRPWLGL